MESGAATTTTRARRTSLELRLLFTCLASFLPVTAVAFSVASRLQWRPAVTAGFAVAIVAGATIHILLARRTLRDSLGSVRSMVTAIRHRDYSIRLRPSPLDDELDGLIGEMNRLADALRDDRLSNTEADAFLLAVLSEIDVAIFVFDDQQCLRLSNRAAERLMVRTESEMLDKTAESLDLAEFLDLKTMLTIERTFPAGHGRWVVSRAVVRDNGRPNQLLFVSDLGKALRSHERDAWQQLVRVLGHELNNSLAPIQSFASTLESLMQRHREPGSDVLDDVRHGLSVISKRSTALMRFMEAYSRLVRLPPPTFRPVHLERLIRSVTEIHKVAVVDGPDVIASIDEHQIEQLLVNVVKNALEAATSADGVRVRWEITAGEVAIRVIDDGPGLPGNTDPFIPLFSTKRQGSGIGLTLSRHIADAHGGSVMLQNRSEGGCEAIVTLPL